MSIRKILYRAFVIVVAFISYFVTAAAITNKNVGAQQNQNVAIYENNVSSINNDTVVIENSKKENEESNIIDEKSEGTKNNSNEFKSAKSDDELVRIKTYIPDIVEDIRYATVNNFTKQVIYEDSSAYLRYGTVKKLINVQNELKSKGYKLVVWDAYRPVEAQYKLWEICPDPDYVSNPNNGYSNHSRGNTIDISIVKLDGREVELPSGYDDFTEKADRDYSDVSAEAKNNAEMIENIMEKYGFKGYQKEWWHFTDTVSYNVVK